MTMTFNYLFMSSANSVNNILKSQRLVLLLLLDSVFVTALRLRSVMPLFIHSQLATALRPRSVMLFVIDSQLATALSL